MSSKPMSIFDVTSKRGNHEQYRKDKTIYCGNCGEKNHIYRDCIHPVISLGIILFQKNYTTQKLEFLLVRRKDSIGYVEFIRGRYAYNDKDYIQNLFEQMSIDELHKLKSVSYDILWKNLWMEDKFKIKKKHFTNEYEQGKKKYDTIKNGYKINDEFVNIDYFIKNVKSSWLETEWGIPKGRRNLRESNYDAAKREFMEETGITETEFTILSSENTFVEEYTGSDNVKYRHIYYIARYFGNKDDLAINKNDKHQVTEISKIGFFEIEQCLTVIRDYYNEKKMILQQVNDYIITNELHKVTLNSFKTSKYSPILINEQMSKSL